MTHPGGRDSLSRDTWCWFVIPGGWSSAVWYDSVGGWEWWLIQGVISRVLSHESCLIALGVESHIWYRASSSVFMRHDSLSWCYHNTLNRWFRVVTDTGRSFLYDVSWVRDWYRAFFSVWRVMSSWLIQDFFSVWRVMTYDLLRWWKRVVTDKGRSFLYDVSWVRDWYRALFSVWRVMRYDALRWWRKSWLIPSVIFRMKACPCYPYVLSNDPYHLCMYVCMYVCMDVWMYVCVYVCMYLNTCVRVCVYVCMYV